jgi:hypothetical protein
MYFVAYIRNKVHRYLFLFVIPTSGVPAYPFSFRGMRSLGNGIPGAYPETSGSRQNHRPKVRFSDRYLALI